MTASPFVGEISNEAEVILDCSLTEKYFKEGKIQNIDYQRRLKACRGTGDAS